MTTSASIQAFLSDGRPASVLADLIAKRAKVLKETTSQAATAIAIQALRSLRADTPKVKRKASIIPSRWRVKCSYDATYKPGWARGHRVVRSGGQSSREVNGLKVINLAGPYDHNGDKNVKAYKLACYGLGADPFYPNKGEWILVLARSLTDVHNFASRRIQRRIQQYAGVSKRCLTACMRKVHAASAAGGAEKLPADIIRLAEYAAKVNVNQSGYAEGAISIKVLDDIPFSEDCLKTSTAEALGRAANGITATLNRALSRDFLEPHPTPFPEFKR